MSVSNYHLPLILVLTGIMAYAQQPDLPYERAVGPRIFVRVEENSDRTLLLMQFSQIIAPEQLPTPILEQHPPAGEFVITLKNISGATFFGPTNQKVGERIPIEYSVHIPDSTQIILRGKTAPFQRLEYVYHYNKSCYMFEIYYFSVGSKLGTAGRPAGIAPSGKRDYQSYARRAILIAAMFLIAIGLYLVLGHRRKPALTEKGQPPINRQLQMTPEVESNISNTESDEEKIKRLAREKKISYDEAALLITMSAEERDGMEG